MATNGTALPPLPNPTTPMAFLPRPLAEQYQAAIYLYCVVWGALIWDWLMSIPDEIKMVRMSKFRLPMVAYFVSRIGTLVHCTMAVMFPILVHVKDCQTFIVMNGVFFAIAIPASSALFFFRVKAVYCHNKFITGIFGFLWVALLGLCILSPLSLKGGHLGTTQYCIPTHIGARASAPLVLNAILDTMVFFAISFRIVSYAIVGDTYSSRIQSFFRGQGLPLFSKSLLQGGQLYYFATIGLNIAVTIMVFAPVPQFLHPTLTVPNVALESVMACRVFRYVKIGVIPADGTSQRTTSQPTTAIAFSSSKDRVVKMDASGHTPVFIGVTKTMEVSGDHSYGSKTENWENEPSGLASNRV